MEKSKIYLLSLENKSLIKEKIEYLSYEEIEKSKKFFHKRDKENYLLSHIYKRELLSKHYPKISPQKWKFHTNSYGKPYISQKKYQDVFFNISHTNSHFAMIISDKECGIDIEEEGSITIDQNILDLVLTPKEQILYKRKKVSFYTLWTLKEAYLKAIGKGLFVPLEEIEFLSIKNQLKMK